MAYFFDNYPLEGFSFPKSDYILSVVFEALVNGNYQRVGNVYMIKNGDEVLNVFKKGDKVFVNEVKNGKIVKEHWFR
jgi:hypothetical protein